MSFYVSSICELIESCVRTYRKTTPEPGEDTMTGNVPALPDTTAG